jgi:biopolymer transport protein ExbD
MSASASHDRCEPNLTPMLDMVLQLVMFFMLCANFLMEELNKSVKLPEAVSARQLDPNVKKTIFINLTYNPNASDSKNRYAILVNQNATTKAYQEAKNMVSELKAQLELDEKITPKDVWAKGGGRTTLILRADHRASFEEVNKILIACKEAGYKDIQMRANQAGTVK